MAAFSLTQIFLMVGMLVTGSINTLSKKAQNDCTVKGFPDKSRNNTETEHSFDHPWFQTWIMFIGESICLVGLALHRRKEKRQWAQQAIDRERAMVQPESSSSEPQVHARILQVVVLLPTCCDLVGTSLAGIGLVYVDASVWQMLRGSIIIFAGILSKIFLKRKLKASHWVGMITVMFGLVLVGCSSVFKSQSHKTAGSKTLLGIALILGSQIVSASQMVIEETFLKKKNLHPLHVVGLEGSYGVLLMTFAVLPAMYFIPGSDVNNSYENSLDALYQISNSPRLVVFCLLYLLSIAFYNYIIYFQAVLPAMYFIPGSDVNNSYENSLDALYQISNSPRLVVFCLLYLLSIAFYNYFGLAVTRSLTAVHRTLIDACRTIMVWVFDLIIFYAFDPEFGEPFDKTYGILQIDGFLFLMIGTAMYNQLLHLRNFVPCITFQTEEMKSILPGGHGNIQDDRSYQDDSEDEAINERTKLLKENYR